MRGAVTERGFEFEHHMAAVGEFEPLVGDGWPRNVAAQSARAGSPTAAWDRSGAATRPRVWKFSSHLWFL